MFVSQVQLFVTPWAVTCQAHLFMEFSRQEYRSGQPIPSAGDLPNPGTEPSSPVLQADSFLSEPPGWPRLYLIKFKLKLISPATFSF